MDAIFNFCGSIIGYILWFFYYIVGNYGVAIILFTILFKVILFPLSVKQQKSMAVTSRIAEKQKELSKKYANDKRKYQEEVQKLYAKEGAKPGGGCLTTLLPFPLMIGLYYTILNPLQNALHLSSEVIANATNLLNQIPGASMNIGGRLSDMSMIRHFPNSSHLFIGIYRFSSLYDVDKRSNERPARLYEICYAGITIIYCVACMDHAGCNRFLLDLQHCNYVCTNFSD